MTFIPPVVAPVSTERSASPRARELSTLVRDTIARYREEHPAVSDEEVAEALALVRQGTGRGDLARALLVVGLIATLTIGAVVFLALL